MVNPTFVPDVPAELGLAHEVRIDAGGSVFGPTQNAANCLYLIDGSVRVFTRSIDGREVVLYRVRPGELCTLTTACLLGKTPYPAAAVAETACSARLIPAARFNELLQTSPDFRSFVFAGLSGRLAELMDRIGQLALESVQSRLAHCLLRRANPDGVVLATHDELALEIGTAREVVSRRLKSLEQAGILTTRRGRVTLRRPESLRAGI